MTNRQTPLLLVVCVLLCLPQATQPQETPESEVGAPVITKAVTDLSDATRPRITVVGENFGTTPRVFLGEDMGTLVSLSVRLVDEPLIVADLPRAIVPGTYVLVVQAAAGPANTAFVEVNIGTPEPQGGADAAGVLPDAEEPREADSTRTRPTFG